MCMSGIHYLPEEEEEVKEIKKQVDENLICSYSGLPSVASYQNKKDKEYVHNIRRQKSKYR